LKVVILAGGMGTRMGEETKVIPKPMVEVGGKPMLWHIMNWYAMQGFNDFIICCGYKGHIIKEYFWNSFHSHRDFAINVNNKEKIDFYSNPPMGDWKITCIDTGEDTMTGGRILKVLPFIGDNPFMLTYGDGVSNVDIKKLLAFHKEHKAPVTFTAVHSPGRFGVVHFDEEVPGYVGSFREKPVGQETEWVNGGFFVIDEFPFHALDTNKPEKDIIWEKDILPRLAEEGNLTAYKHEGFWKCMDYYKDKLELEELYKEKDHIYG